MKKIILSVILICVTLSLMSQLFSYKELYTVDNTPQKINIKADFKSDNLEELINESLRITLRDLSFSLKSGNNSNVNDMYKTKKAHCVGYSNYFNSVLYSLIKYNKLEDIKISHVRAKVSFLGCNLHVINKKELKDHDICVIYDKKNNKKYIVDPSLSEVFGNIINN